MRDSLMALFQTLSIFHIKGAVLLQTLIILDEALTLLTDILTVIDDNLTTHRT
jgi:hypothetical protein